MPIIFLHIGMPKAGSSSLQICLNGFDDGRIRYANLGAACHSTKMMCRFSSDPDRNRFFQGKKLDKDVIRRMGRRCEFDLRKEMALGRDGLVISGEAIDLLNATDVTAMDEFFESHGYRLEVLAYVREPVGFISSAFQQSVKRDKANFDVPRPNYRQRYQAYIDVLGSERLTLLDFRRESLRNGSVVADFAARVGLDESRLAEVRANDSLPAAAVAHLYFWNRFGGHRAWDVQRALTRNLMAEALGRHFSGRFRLSARLIQAVADFDDFEWIERTGGFPVTTELKRFDGDEPDAIGSERDLAALRDATLPQLEALLEKLGIKLPARRASRPMMRKLEFHFEQIARQEIRERQARRKVAA